MKRRISVVVALLILGSYISTPSMASEDTCRNATIVGTSGNDEIYGTEGDDVICTFAGDDRIFGLGGNDLVVSGEGEDHVDLGLGNDEAWAGDGNDLVLSGDGDDTIYGGFGDDLIQLGEGNDDAFGEAGEDIIEGFEGDDYLLGGDGADQLYGGDGLDSLLGESGNDGLNGGLGADELSGGLGSNVCAKDLGDRVTSCFFDKSAPTLVNFAFNSSSTTVDSSRNPVQIPFRLTVQDVGAGISNFSLCFNYDAESCNYAEIWSNSLRVIASNGFRTVYEGALNFSRNMPIQTIRLVGFQAQDRAFNRTNLSYSTLRKKGLAVGIKQIGAPDRVSPKITSVRFLNGRLFNNSDELREVEIGYSNSQGEPFDFRLEYKLNDSGAMNVVLGAHFKFPNHPYLENYSTPSEYLQNDGCIPTEGVGCISEGNEYQGKAVFLVRLDARNWDTAKVKYYPGTLLLDGYPTVTDVFGNSSRLRISASQRASMALAKKFTLERPVTYKDNDRSKPTLVSMVLSSRFINTANSNQVVTAIVKVKDSGVGWLTGFNDSVGIDVTLPKLPGEMEPTSFSCSSLLTETGLIATFNLTCEFPAHVRDGYYTLNLDVTDNSTQRNHRRYSPEALKAVKAPYWIKNG